MSELLFENPFVVGVTGTAFVLIALVTWVQGGFRAALYSAIGFALLTLILLLVNINVQTDRETIQTLLHQVGRDLEHNEFDKVIAVIHPAAVEAIQRAKSELHNYKFSMARVTGK